ncbi:MAG: cupin domain-containing protein [Candidatus Scalindua sp.]|nr:cupin domain-containing protein [Candidatus Scalindua sp.]MCR4344161.1 cupin domain-containing protein [Candidatus Scalindua sp.]
MNLIKLREKIQFGEQFRPQILFASPDAKVPMICLEPGQEIPAHPSGTGVFYILEGKGIMSLDGEEIELSKGKVVFAPEGSERGIRGIERLVAIAVHIS